MLKEWQNNIEEWRTEAKRWIDTLEGMLSKAKKKKASIREACEKGNQTKNITFIERARDKMSGERGSLCYSLLKNDQESLVDTLEEVSLLTQNLSSILNRTVESTLCTTDGAAFALLCVSAQNLSNCLM